MAALLRGSLSPERNSNTKSSSRRPYHVRTTDPRLLRRSRNDQQQQQQQQQQHYSTRNLSPRQMPCSTSSPMMSTAVSLEVASSIKMERTRSGNSIMSDTLPYEPPTTPNKTLTERDLSAAHRVEKHFRALPTDRKHERILRKLIHRGNPSVSDLDDDALASIVNSTNAIFFRGVLSGRVQWEWSSQSRYHTELIGTTALRRRADGHGFETLIVLSEPILKSDKYDRRLLLSAFLHELIHCYLFILCGFEARRERGHTEGFHVIAGIIDGWVGKGYLSLCSTKANLDYFRRGRGMMVLGVNGQMDIERGEEIGMGMHGDLGALEDPRGEVGTGRGLGLEHPHVLDCRHGHDGCNQSPRPESRLVNDVPDLRLGYY